MIYFKFVQAGLSHEELSVAVEMLSAVAVLNEVLDTKDPQAVIEQLTDSPLGFSNMDQDNLNRYTGWVLRSHWWIYFLNLWTIATAHILKLLFTHLFIHLRQQNYISHAAGLSFFLLFPF